MDNIQYEKNIIKKCFLDKEAFLFCLERISTEKIFTNEFCRLYWQIFCIIYKEDQVICKSTVNDVLSYTKNKDLIPDFDLLVNEVYEDEEEWQYHLFYLDEQYRKKVIFEEVSFIQNNITKHSASELTSRLAAIVKEVSSGGVREVSFKQAYKSTIQNIQDIKDGKERSFLITGNKQFDEVVALSKKKVILIAAQKKIGKSRMVIDMMDRVIGNNENVAIQWFSLEMQSDELIRCFISRKTHLTDRQLTGKGYKITDGDMKNIEMAFSYFQKYPIEFIDEPVNIFNICSKFEQFKQKNALKHCICIIDNLGLIKPHINESNVYEDDVSRMIKNLRDTTEGTIILLHHLTKESESKWNKETGYEPKVVHIRGSSRIADFANQVILLHRPDHYSDLREMAMTGKPDANGDFKSKVDGVFQVDVAANRDGQEKKIIMQHEIAYCLFYE